MPCRAIERIERALRNIINMFEVELLTKDSMRR
jgi:hypothetical protein